MALGGAVCIAGFVLVFQASALGLDATGATVWERSQDTWYILAGDRRIYEVPVEREDCLRTRAVAVQVKVGEQTMTERVDVPAPACAP